MSAEKTKLTKTFVESLSLSPDKQIFYRDSELVGFALRVTTSKVYVVERRIGNGRSSVRVTIGRHGEVTAQQARDQARMLLAQMAQGINPNDAKKKKRDQALAEYAKEDQQPTLLAAYTAYKKERQLGDKTLKDYEQCLNDYFVDWRDIQLKNINRKMIQDRHTLLSERSKARANLAMRFLRAIFNFSIEHYLDELDRSIIDISNPVKTLSAKKSWNKIRRKKGHIRKDQLHDWVDAVLAATWTGQGYYNHNAYTNQDFMLTVLLTGFRREETECLEWEHIDFKYGTISSVDPKNGEPLTLPMGNMLQYIMKERFARSGGKPYVFQARQGDGHVTNRSKAREKISESSGIHFTYHDLRRTFSSIANSINIGSYTIKRLINHTLDETDVTDGYVQVSFDDLKDAMNKIENVIFTDKAKQTIHSRSFNTPKRHYDYFDKAVPVQNNDPALLALSKIDRLKALMKKSSFE